MTILSSSLSAFVGVLVGGVIQRKTAKQGWLFQKRSETFERFLSTLEKCCEQVAHYLREKPGQEPWAIEQTTIDLYQPAFTQARIARLFIKKESREKVEKLVREIRALQVTRELGDERHRTIIEKADELQDILESNLDKN